MAKLVIADIEPYTNNMVHVVVDSKTSAVGAIQLTPMQCILFALKLMAAAFRARRLYGN